MQLMKGTDKLRGPSMPQKSEKQRFKGGSKPPVVTHTGCESTEVDVRDHLTRQDDNWKTPRARRVEEIEEENKL
ncbi:unnamed protein product [Hydatigera taeniaeformis]|uniref:Uncharacterized protein n=1 Tax=Hydatigena taeniaeformis TaxID=6205 RepID=A0A0R3WNN4_HYDTA|nr:unnamed protein product [Hydatigera taeniaeformis]